MKAYELPDNQNIISDFESAAARYASFGIDVNSAMQQALKIPISIHCWQADDVRGLEQSVAFSDGGGIAATGNYPGRARSGDEIRQDLAKVLELLPGTHKVNLHAFYAEDTEGADRDKYEPGHFARWLSWAKGLGVGLDFNPTYFSHPKADDGFTLSHPEKEIRDFWVNHGIACRRIAEVFGRETGQPSIINHWIPDGIKDTPADRWEPRARLLESLDRIFSDKLGIDRELCIDSVEGKLFGIGSEDFVAGSTEFYSHYALTRGITLCLDMGHFHPTETIVDKISAFMQFHKRLLLHVSRPVRWDSDHIVIFNDDLRGVFHELVRGNALDRAFVALDYFDASVNRITAYVTGARAARKAILYALLEPVELLKQMEKEGMGGSKLAFIEELKTMPFGAIWNKLCLDDGVPASSSWIREVEDYEKHVLRKRTD